MASTVSTDLDVRIAVTEIETGLGAGQRPSKLQHLIEIAKDHANGTGSLQNDLVYSARVTAAASADTYDLDALTSTLTGDAVAFAEITAFAIYNESTTSTEELIIGAGSNPFITWLNATGDAVVVGASGLFFISSPIDGYAVTATTGDILTVDPAADTITYQILIIGRSA